MTTMVVMLASPGTRVVMNMCKSSRDWTGDKKPADGTRGVVRNKVRSSCYKERWGVSAHFWEPGIWEYDATCVVDWEDGRVTAGDNYSMDFEDRGEFERLRQELWVKPIFEDCSATSHDREVKLLNYVRISDLPATEFWEGDIVREKSPRFECSSEFNLAVKRIEYSWLEPGDDRGVPYSVEWVKDNGEYAGRGSTYLYENQMELVKRGNLWKSHHGEPVTFWSLKDEAAFAENTGKTVEVRNPVTKLYSWEKGEILKAVSSGLADGFCASGLMGSVNLRAVKFLDRDLGERVRSATIEGFSL